MVTRCEADFGHVAGRRGGVGDRSLASVDSISSGILYGFNGTKRRISYRVGWLRVFRRSEPRIVGIHDVLLLLLGESR